MSVFAQATNALRYFLTNAGSDYHCGFELEEIQQVFDAMSANYAAWATG
jgi:hypothetical protein